MTTTLSAHVTEAVTASYLRELAKQPVVPKPRPRPVVGASAS
jgi:hypothetical protein